MMCAYVNECKAEISPDIVFVNNPIKNIWIQQSTSLFVSIFYNFPIPRLCLFQNLVRKSCFISREFSVIL